MVRVRNNYPSMLKWRSVSGNYDPIVMMTTQLLCFYYLFTAFVGRGKVWVWWTACLCLTSFGLISCHRSRVSPTDSFRSDSDSASDPQHEHNRRINVWRFRGGLVLLFFWDETGVIMRRIVRVVDLELKVKPASKHSMLHTHTALHHTASLHTV